MSDAEDMLLRAGPGHMVYSAKWTNRDGSEESVSILLQEGDDGRQMLRDAGWPGHAGRRLDYLKSDLRRFFRSIAGG